MNISIKNNGNTKGYTATQLQGVAIICMIIDHIAWVFFPDVSVLSVSMHFIGRITFPIMAYFIGEGYRKTSNAPKYIGRVFTLAFISIIPYFLMAKDFVGIGQNTVFTLALGLSALYFSDKVKNPVGKIIIVALFCLLSMLILADVAVSGVIAVYTFGKINDRKKAAIIGVSAMLFSEVLLVFLIQGTGGFDFLFFIYAIAYYLSALLITFYNGDKGNKAKYGFYVIYPTHLLLIWFAHLLIG